MIKLFALILMILDHTGHLLHSGVIKGKNIFTIAEFLTTIGRLSMPLFAYCIARGFNHYLKTGNLKKYFINIAIMACSAQVPYWFLRYKMMSYGIYPQKISIFYDFAFNIGFTWLVSLLLLCVLNKINFSSKTELIETANTKAANLSAKKNLIFICLTILICIFSIFSKVEYSLYGVLYPVMFYYCCFKYDNLIVLFICNCAQYFIYCIVYGVSFINRSGQIFAIFAVFLLLYLQKKDNAVKLPKFIFYWFYPVHFALISGLYLTVFVQP